MRSLAVSFLLLIGSVAHAQLEVLDDLPTLYIQTDPKVMFYRLKLDGQPVLGLIGSYDAEGTPSVSLYIASLSSGWRYVNCRDTHWRGDGQPLTMPDPTYKRDFHKSGRGSETLLFSLTCAQLDQLANAQRVEYTICEDEQIVSPQDMRNFRDMARHLREHDPGRPISGRPEQIK